MVVSLITFIGLLSLAHSESSPYHKHICDVTFYENGNFEGDSYGPYGVGRISPSTQDAIPTNQISSLKLKSTEGYDCFLVLFDGENYTPYLMSVSAENGAFVGIANFQTDQNINDRISSATLRYVPRDPWCKVQFSYIPKLAQIFAHICFSRRLRFIPKGISEERNGDHFPVECSLPTSK